MLCQFKIIYIYIDMRSELLFLKVACDLGVSKIKVGKVSFALTTLTSVQSGTSVIMCWCIVFYHFVTIF